MVLNCLHCNFGSPALKSSRTPDIEVLLVFLVAQTVWIKKAQNTNIQNSIHALLSRQRNIAKGTSLQSASLVLWISLLGISGSLRNSDQSIRASSFRSQVALASAMLDILIILLQYIDPDVTWLIPQLLFLYFVLTNAANVGQTNILQTWFFLMLKGIHASFICICVLLF